VLKTGKLINHIKYFHNFSNFSLIDSFASTAVNFNFNDNTLTLEPKVNSLLDPTSTTCITLNQASPQEEYCCVKCNIVYADNGAHFLFQHGMARCRKFSCETFFENENMRKIHEEAQHSREFPCSVCNKIFGSQYLLVVHRCDVHDMQTCIFCDSMILTSLEPFANHLAQHHYIKNNKLVNNAKVTPVIHRLINQPLIKFEKNYQKVECNLCESSKFECLNGGEEFVRHLLDFHHIKHPSRIIFPLFNGKEFHYQSLKNDEDEVSHGLDKMINIHKIEKREIRKKVPKRKNNLAVKQIKDMSNQCIMCGKGFPSSEDVQRHLLTNHINVDASGSDNTKQKSQIYDIKEESETNELNPIVKIETASDETTNKTYLENDIVDETDIEIDEEHYSINHVEVSISENQSDPLEETDYRPIIDESIYILDEDDSDENETLQDIDDENYTEDFQLVNMPNVIEKEIIAETVESGEIIGDIGKSPVYLKCEVCGVILTSILNFTTHMKKLHKNSDQEKNKPFTCDICNQGFYFQSSLNSHKSKAHQETSGQTFRCPICTSVTNSKNGMRRHLRNSHKRTDLLNEELSYKCKICNQLFWSIAERTEHIAESHKEASENLEKCFICFHISPNRHALRRHFQRMHPNEPLFENVSFKCGDCGLLYPQRQLLSTHIKAEHPKAITYQCAYCPQQLKNKKSLQTHVNQHKKTISKDQGITYTCNVCEKEFSTKKALKTHFSSSHSDKAKKGFVCKVCNKVLETANDRSLHYKVDHPDSNPYLCSICGLGFVTKSSLYNHRMCHKNQKQHKCDHCGKEFNRRDSFNEHVLIHIGPRHKCPHCPKEFVQKSNLKRHVRIHLGIKPYKCKFCTMTFSDKGACNSHQRTHTGEEREACPICNVVFSKKQKLKYHMRIHTGEGLETCHICNKIFTHSYALNVHLRTHSKENNFMCHECKKIFQNGSKLYKHILTHGKQKLECDRCSKTFKFSKLLNRHIMSVHEGVDGLACSFEQCNTVFNKLSKIRDHVRDAHSVKNPMFGNHFTDEYNTNPSLDKKLFDTNEIDFAHIYEGLDIQIDNDVLGNSHDEKIKIKIKGKKERNKVEEEDEPGKSDTEEVKEEPLDAENSFE